MSELRGQDLVKYYGDLEVLRGVTFAVDPGQVKVIVGPSGSGKSTLLRVLAGLEAPDSGTVTLEDRAPGPGEVGMVFQRFNLFSNMCALDNVMCGLVEVRRLPKAEAREQALAFLERVGLADHHSKFPDELSGGQQQRVAIARALINEPSILLADEPTGNLDTRTSIEVMGIFQRLNQERGITVLLITHEMDIAEYGTRFVKFRDGKVVLDQAITKRRNADDELAALPPPEVDVVPGSGHAHAESKH
jgi:putative ABC transport system ATP-binding protein